MGEEVGEQWWRKSKDVIYLRCLVPMEERYHCQCHGRRSLMRCPRTSITTTRKQGGRRGINRWTTVLPLPLLPLLPLPLLLLLVLPLLSKLPPPPLPLRYLRLVPPSVLPVLPEGDGRS